MNFSDVILGAVMLCEIFDFRKEIKWRPAEINESSEGDKDSKSARTRIVLTENE